MNANNAKPVINVGFPISSLLGAAFIVMKLGGWGSVANWSWWWVTAPFWGPVALFIGLMILILTIYFGVLGILYLIERD